MGPICCQETLVHNYQSTPRNIPEEQRSHLHRGGSLKSRILHICYMNFALKRVNMLAVTKVKKPRRQRLMVYVTHVGKLLKQRIFQLVKLLWQLDERRCK
jgi:hypothetical protein